MTSRARSLLAIGAAVTVVGVGLGVVVADAVSGLWPFAGAMIAVVGTTVAVAVVLATTWSATADATADDTAWNEFRRELRRARRSARPLTLLRLPAPDRASSDGPDPLTAVRDIGAGLRLIDRTWLDGDSIYVMLPETSRAAAEVVVERLRGTSAASIVDAMQMATFPEDGLTSGALLAAVHGSAVGQVPIPLRPSVDEPSMRPVDTDAAMGRASAPR